MGTPLKIKILKIGFVHARENQNIGPEFFFVSLGPQIAKFRVGPNRGFIFNTSPYVVATPPPL